MGDGEGRKNIKLFSKAKAIKLLYIKANIRMHAKYSEVLVAKSN